MGVDLFLLSLMSVYYLHVAENTLIQWKSVSSSRTALVMYTTKIKTFTEGYYPQFSTLSVISNGSPMGYLFCLSNIKFVQKF